MHSILNTLTHYLAKVLTQEIFVDWINIYYHSVTQSTKIYSLFQQIFIDLLLCDTDYANSWRWNGRQWSLKMIDMVPNLMELILHLVRKSDINSVLEGGRIALVRDEKGRRLVRMRKWEKASTMSRDKEGWYGAAELVKDQMMQIEPCWLSDGLGILS